jgi:hypothetical protein
MIKVILLIFFFLVGALVYDEDNEIGKRGGFQNEKEILFCNFILGVSYIFIRLQWRGNNNSC